jgi:hypothetical protein
MASISVVDNLNESTFERTIPKAYIFHLNWMSNEANSTPVGIRRYRRSAYLRQVLDAFAEEIKATEGLTEWRSAVLTPVLVRAYHNLNDFARTSIEAHAKKVLLHYGKLTEQHWAAFYFQCDVIDPSNSIRWTSVKEIVPQDTEGVSNSLTRNVTLNPVAF